VLQDSILDAALAELAEGGFDRLTIEAVAQRARTGKSAIYRRWTTKQELAADAIVHALPDAPAAKTSGDLRTDLLSYFQQWADGLAGPLGVAVHALGSDPSVAAVVKERVFAQRERVLRDILEAGVARGDVRPDALVKDCLDVGAALFRTRLEEFGPHIPRDAVAGIVDNVLIPMLRLAPRGSNDR
jgi:AcrR family transcriptional regulator